MMHRALRLPIKPGPAYPGADRDPNTHRQGQSDLIEVNIWMRPNVRNNRVRNIPCIVSGIARRVIAANEGT